MHVKDLFNIQGKVAVVTGGAVGLGEQMATALAEAGANVALSARKVERCKATADKIRKECGVKTMALRCDVAEEADVKNMVDAVLGEFGRGTHVDDLIEKGVVVDLVDGGDAMSSCAHFSKGSRPFQTLSSRRGCASATGCKLSA